MARYIDAYELKQRILKERDAIPLTRIERYSFGVPTPNRDGQAMRGGIRKALRCLEQTPAADVVPKSEVGGFPCVAYNKKHERYQVIHKGKDGRIFASKLYYTRKDAEKALAELKKKYIQD